MSMLPIGAETVAEALRQGVVGAIDVWWYKTFDAVNGNFQLRPALPSIRIVIK